MHMQWQLYLYNMKNVPQMYTARKQFRTICNIYVLSPSVETVLSLFSLEEWRKRRKPLLRRDISFVQGFDSMHDIFMHVFSMCAYKASDLRMLAVMKKLPATSHLTIWTTFDASGLVAWRREEQSSPHLLLSYKLLLIPRGTARSSSFTSKKMKSNLWLIQWSTSAPKKLQMNSGEYRECVGNLSDMGTHVIILLNGALSCIWESVQLD